jgi:CRISPR-associated protein Cas2
MIVLVAYDISNDRTRATFHEFLKEYGLNTQKSVFECDVDEQAIRDILARAASLVDEETDSVRLYRICAACARRTVISGQGIKVTNLDYTVL